MFKVSAPPVSAKVWGKDLTIGPPPESNGGNPHWHVQESDKYGRSSAHPDKDMKQFTKASAGELHTHSSLDLSCLQKRG